MTAMSYVARIPRQLRPGKVLVHNHVRPAGFGPRTPVGTEGFRAWFADPDPEALRACRCGWAPHLPRHYRVRAVPPRVLR